MDHFQFFPWYFRNSERLNTEKYLFTRDLTFDNIEKFKFETSKVDWNSLRQEPDPNNADNQFIVLCFFYEEHYS